MPSALPSMTSLPEQSVQDRQSATSQASQATLPSRTSHQSDESAEVALEFSAALGVELASLRSRTEEQQRQQEEVVQKLQAQMLILEQYVRNQTDVGREEIIRGDTNSSALGRLLDVQPLDRLSMSQPLSPKQLQRHSDDLLSRSHPFNAQPLTASAPSSSRAHRANGGREGGNFPPTESQRIGAAASP